MYIFYICNMKKKKKIFEGTVLLFDTYKKKTVGEKIGVRGVAE